VGVRPMGTRLKYFFPVMLRDLSLRSACDMVPGIVGF
jgi:hypothetical protein